MQAFLQDKQLILFLLNYNPDLTEEMYSIYKEFNFSASHTLNGLEEGHPCMRLHGHNYKVFFHFKGELNANGFIIDYRQLQPIKEYLDTVLDHSHLNDILKIQPSAENIAFFLYSKFKNQFEQLYRVDVKETEKTMASYVED